MNKEEKKAHNRIQYLKYREKILLKNKRHYIKNRERILANHKKRVERNKIKIGWKPKTDWMYTKKICRHCKIETNDLVKSSFKDGRQYYSCNNCNTERVKKYRETKKGKVTTLKAIYKSIKKYSEKQKARVKVYLAVKDGRLLKPDICSDCNQVKKLDGHHKDYSKPLEVTWLCRKCHSKHKKI